MKHTGKQRCQESTRFFEVAKQFAPGGVHSNFRLGMKACPIVL